MLKRFSKMMKVLLPRQDGGEEIQGIYPVAVSYRTAEEIESEDLLHTNVTYTAYGDPCRAPAGGYRRGMILVGESGERYTVLVPIPAPKYWIMKVRRTLTDGEI